MFLLLSTPLKEDAEIELDHYLLFLNLSEALISKLDEVKHHQHTTQFDVKIGAGMDIAIHGENGQSDSPNQSKLCLDRSAR